MYRNVEKREVPIHYAYMPVLFCNSFKESDLIAGKLQ